MSGSVGTRLAGADGTVAGHDPAPVADAGAHLSSTDLPSSRIVNGSCVVHMNGWGAVG